MMNINLFINIANFRHVLQEVTPEHLPVVSVDDFKFYISSNTTNLTDKALESMQQAKTIIEAEINAANGLVATYKTNLEESLINSITTDIVVYGLSRKNLTEFVTKRYERAIELLKQNKNTKKRADDTGAVNGSVAFDNRKHGYTL